PIVDWAEAAALARDRLWGLRRQQGFAAAADAIQHRHGSRRSGLARSGGRRPTGRAAARAAAEASGQLSLDLGG
ncbi:MAG: deoxyribodipyrimidine photolyase, partial [Vulcanococcus sp.]